MLHIVFEKPGRVSGPRGNDMSFIEIVFVFAVFLSASGITLGVAAMIDNWLGPRFWPRYHNKNYWL